MFYFTDKNGYVYERTSYREPGCKSPKSKKICIGKKDENGKFVGNRYFIEREAKKDANKQVSLLELRIKELEEGQKTQIKEEQSTEKIAKAAVSSRKKSGLTYAIESVTENLGINTSLVEVFGEEKSKMLLSLMQYMIATKSGAMDNFEFFHNDHTHACGTDLSSSSISRLFASITEEDITLFFKTLNKNAPKEREKKNYYTSFDSTAFSSYSDDISLVVPSKGKQDPELDHFSLAAIYDTKTHMCGYYRIYRGNIPDIKTVKDLAEVAKAMGFTFNNKIIFDRGYISWENIYLMNKSLKCDVLMMLKSNFGMYSTAITKAGTAFKNDSSCYIPGQDAFGTTVVEDTTLLVEGKEEKLHGFIHVYFSPERYSKECRELEESIDFEIERVNNLIKQGALDIKALKSKKEGITQKLAKYINVKSLSNTKVCVEKDAEAISEKLKSAGYFELYSTENLSARDALLTYRGRDNVERLFNSVKNDLGFVRAEVKNDKTLQGKVFVAMLSATVITHMKSLFRTNRQILTRKFTYNKAILELEAIYTHKLNGKTVYSEISDRQEQILKVLGIENPATNIKVTVKRTYTRKKKSKSNT